MRRSIGLAFALTRTPAAVVGLFESRTCVALPNADGAMPSRSALVAARPLARTKVPSGGRPAIEMRVASAAQPPATLTWDTCHIANVSAVSGTTGSWVRFHDPPEHSGPLHICSPAAMSCEGRTEFGGSPGAWLVAHVEIGLGSSEGPDGAWE